MTFDKDQNLNEPRNDLRTKRGQRRKEIERLAVSSASSFAKRNDLLPQLALETIAIDALIMPKRKLRKADAAHVRGIANSIAVHGFVHPILIGRENLVLDGQARVFAGLQHGLQSIPCVRIDHLTDTEQRTMRLAANRLAEKGQWDLPALALEFEELIVLDAPIEVSGFSPAEIDDIIVVDEEVPGSETGPLAPEIGVEAVARLGDVFQLGDHLIICGDARDPKTLAAIMDQVRTARLVLTDEPYNVPIVGHVTRGQHRSFEMASGEMSASEFLDFNVNWIAACVEWLRDGGVLATFIDFRGLHTVLTAAKELGLHQLNHVVWAKTNAGMGSLYRSQTEHLPLFKKGSAVPLNNVNLGKSGRWRSNLWTYPGASSFGSDARRGLQDHPTVKPTMMLQDALLDLSDRGEVVLDPFLGSGSTLIACEMTGRVCRGVEIDPLYIDTIIRRFEAHTGQVATLFGTGESFQTLQASRRSM